MKVWINGQYLSLAEAKVGFFDGGFQHAIGLFETMLARDGAVLRLEEHLERLALSAKELRLFESLRIEPLAEAIHGCLVTNALRNARIRVTITSGDAGKPFAGANAADAKSGSPQPTVAIHAQPPTEYPVEMFTHGVGITVASSRVNPLDEFASHKTLAYWPRIAAIQRAAESGCSEALWFSVSNHLASGSVSSVFLAKNGRLRVPFARGDDSSRLSAVLPGCTRAAVIVWAEGTGIEVERADLTIEDVFAADEVFLTNASWGVLPVIRVERHVVADAKPGPIALHMREKWLA